MVPKVSVIVTVYLAEKYLDKCINSILNQTLTDIELILVNDGSPDNSGEICDRFARKDQRVKVIHQSNQGNSAARNNGTALAKGDFITYVDCDDWIELNTCEVAYREALEGHLDLVFWSSIKEYEDQSVLSAGPFGHERVFQDEEAIDLHRRLTGPIKSELGKPHLIDSFISVWGKLYRSELIKENQISFVDTNEIGAADIFFSFQIFHHARKIKYLHLFLSHYRKDNPNSMTKNHGSKLFQRFQLLFDRMENEIKNRNLPNSYSTALKNRICISMMNIGLSETSDRNTNGLSEKLTNLKSYLTSARYQAAFESFELQYLPLHWKLFFTMCKWKKPLIVFILLRLMAYMRRK